MDQLLVSIPVFNSQGVDQLEESRRMLGITSLPSIPHHHTSINNIYFYSDIICVWVVQHKYLDELNLFVWIGRATGSMVGARSSP